MSTGLSVPTLKRPRHRYPVPESCRHFEGDPSEVVMEEPSLQQELDAAKSAAAQGYSLVPQATDYETLRRVVVEINQQEVVDHDWIDKTSAPCRQYLLRVLVKISVGPGKDIEEALGKGRVEV